jgi:hypothetical protein
LALFFFGVAFGYVEAAVVVYLRALYEPLHLQFYPDAPHGDLFPLITLAQLASAGTQPSRWLAAELAREGATLVMLAAVALVMARNFRQWFAAFMISFGLWDISYYFFLKVLLDWPGSWMTWDLLFLLPVPWASPVLAPMLVSVSMIGSGTYILQRESTGWPLRLRPLIWAAAGAACLLLMLAFCGDYRNLLDGGLPSAFPWTLFTLGEGIGMAAFLWATFRCESSHGG